MEEYQVILEGERSLIEQSFFSDLEVAKKYAEEAINKGYDSAEIYSDAKGFIMKLDKKNSSSAKESLEVKAISSASESFMKSAKLEIEKLDNRDHFTKGTILEYLQPYSPVMRKIGNNDSELRQIFEDPNFSLDNSGELGEIALSIKETIINKTKKFISDLIYTYRAYFDNDPEKAFETIKEYLDLTKEEVVEEIRILDEQTNTGANDDFGKPFQPEV